MAITKEVRYDMEILGEWAIHVRRRDAYVENGEVLSANFFRYVINVTDDYSSEPTKVKKCALLCLLLMLKLRLLPIKLQWDRWMKKEILKEILLVS